MRHTISLGLMLAVVWTLLSGHSEPLIIGLAVVSVVLVIFISHRMDVVDHEGHSFNMTWKVLTYWPWLFWQILIANIDVIKVILGPGPVRPVMFRVRCVQRGEVYQVIFANSITLTPGTISVGHEDGMVTIHSLTDALASDAADKADGSPSDMNLRCAKLEDRVTPLETAA